MFPFSATIVFNSVDKLFHPEADMPLMLLKTPPCAMFLRDIVTGNAAAQTSLFFSLN